MAVIKSRFVLRPYVLFTTVVVFLSLCSSSRSIPDSDALIKLKRSFTVTKALDSWVPGSPPCNGTTKWHGILCINGVVTGVSLQGLGLSGTIDVSALRAIRGLRIISFTNNSFTGPIPELGGLTALRAIYLTNNDFSGEIPADFFARMTYLKKLWLPNNKFSGPVPASLSRLARLVELRLENNRFGGRVPPLYNATASGSLASLNLSGNGFVGEVPESLTVKFGPAAFLGNPGLCGEALGRECGSSDGSAKSKKVMAAAVTSGALVAVVVILAVRFKKSKHGSNRSDDKDFSGSGTSSALEVHVSNLNKREIDSVKRAGTLNSLALKGGTDPGSRSSHNNNDSNGSSNSGSGGGSKADIVMVNEEKGVFGMPDLMKAVAEVLGGSEMGSSYKAVMANGVAVVVKRIKEMNVGGKDRFQTEIKRLGTVTHTNVLSPLAYYFRKEEKLIVSEYVPGGSLLYLLHGERGSSRSELNWASRLKIVHGIAKGLSHIHTELSNLDLPHGNLKSSNVLLGPDFSPLLSDYGFAHLINTSAVSSSLFAFQAEPANAVSPQSDVFCLGLLILEVMTGRFPSHYLHGTGKLGGTDLVRLAAASAAAGDEAAMLDPEIAAIRGPSLSRMCYLLRLGADCADTDPGRRPTAAGALQRVEEIVAAEFDMAGGDEAGQRRFKSDSFAF